MGADVSIPKGCYVYAIHVDGVLRYIGKGTGDRMFAHMKEVRLRQTRQFWVKNISPPFQQKLTEAVVKGAVVEEIVLADDLTSKQAYKLEYRYLEKMVHEGKRQQLWNVIPQSIYTPQEYDAYVQRLTKSLSSRKSSWPTACPNAASPAWRPSGREHETRQSPPGSRAVFWRLVCEVNLQVFGQVF